MLSSSLFIAQLMGPYHFYRTVEEEVFRTAMSLADRYEVSKWEMLMTHLECLFLDVR